ncbi:MAG TPA: PIN domain nuclease [Pseudonocardiaceae bacterium]|nr:PIN domain nuclease [Pseudonocardiaceae bacterium]
MIAVDSSVWIDFLTDRTTPQVNVLDHYLARNPSEIALVDIVLTEVLQGLPSHHVHRVESLLLDLDVLHLKWISDYRAAAGLYRAARESGVTIRGTIDCLIAAVCIREQATLLHTDVDFDRLAAISELSTIKVG